MKGVVMLLVLELEDEGECAGEEPVVRVARFYDVETTRELEREVELAAGQANDLIRRQAREAAAAAAAVG